MRVGEMGVDSTRCLFHGTQLLLKRWQADIRHGEGLYSATVVLLSHVAAELMAGIIPQLPEALERPVLVL